jgi:hypothetical protein
MLEKDSNEWWRELSYLGQLLQEWEASRESQEIQQKVYESMRKLGLIVPNN